MFSLARLSRTTLRINLPIKQIYTPSTSFSTIYRAMATEFKLKDLSSLDLKHGQKLEAEVEGVDGGKVLLVKVGNKIHATSTKCTHYGAPLKNGVVDGNGRITCPWHGACFNVTTGDVEDAPALDGLTTYQVYEKDGAVYIKGEEATIKANRRNLKLKCSAKGSEKVVIVGGGSGALGASEGLREGGFTGSITMITSEGYLPIDRTKLSKALIADVSKLAWRSDEFYKDASVDIIEDKVTSVDFGGKKVKTDSGKSYEYTKLILATGGTPRWLPLPGLKGDLKNVFVLRTIPDVQGILAAADGGSKKIVVIGSSFIGMEVANALAGKKHQVSIIGMEDEPMERVMGKQVGKVFRGLVEKAGVKFYMGASVDKATASKSDSSKVGAVYLKDGTELEADLVVEGVGVGPETSYLRDNKEVELNKDGSLTVDETFAVKGLKDVFAVGDIATYPYHGPGGTANPVRIEHWNVAQNSGRSVAQIIVKPSVKPAGFIPVFWSAMGQQLRYAGNTMNGYDDVVIQGDIEKPSFVAYYTKGDVVVAAASMGKDPVVMQVAELMRRSKMVGKSELEKGVDVLTIDVPKEITI